MGDSGAKKTEAFGRGLLAYFNAREEEFRPFFYKLHGQGGMGPRENKCSFIPAMDELGEPKTRDACAAL